MNIPRRDHAKQCAKRCAFGEKMSVSFHLRTIPTTTEKVTCAGTYLWHIVEDTLFDFFLNYVKLYAII